MKKIILVASILLLAAGCGKSAQVSQSVPPDQGSQIQPVTTTTPVSSTTTPAVPIKPSTPSSPSLTLNVYNNAAEHFKVSYLNYFNLYSGSVVKANSTKGVNFSACQPYGISPDICFVLNNQPYASTNLQSAGVTVSVLPNKTTLGDCAVLDPQAISGGKMTPPVQSNGIVFITGENTDAGAGNFYETHFNRTFYGTICYELDETVHWTNAQNYTRARAEFDRTDVWNKLDVLRNGFQFVK